MGNLNKDDVRVEVNGLQPFVNSEYQGFSIIWSGNIGFGEYTIYQNVDDPNKWKAESECMDSQEDKWFLKKLLENFIDQLEITE